MNRFLTLALCVTLLTLLGCGGEASKEKPKVVVAMHEKKEEKKQEVKTAERKTVKVDLTPYDLRGVITLPEGARLERSFQGEQPVIVRIGDEWFMMEGFEDKSFEIARNSLADRDPRGTALIDEPGVFLFRDTTHPDRPLALLHLIETKKSRLLLWATGAANDEARLRDIIRIGKTFEYSPEMFAQDQKVESLHDELKRARLWVNFRRGWTLELHLGEDSELTESQFARLSEASGVLSLYLEGPAKRFSTQLQSLLKSTSIRHLSLTEEGEPFPDQWDEMFSGAKGIRSLHLDGVTIGSKGLAALKGIPGLKELEFENIRLSDEAIRPLETLVDLESLILSETNITDAGLASLRNLTQIRELGLGKTRITDSGLQHLSGMTRLQLLHLGGTRINGSGFAYLRGMTELEELDLDNTDVDDLGLQRLKPSKLTDLSLAGTSVTDGGMPHVGTFRSLTSLNLNSTGIGDAGLEPLSKLDQLEYLRLHDCRIRGGGLRHLGAWPKLLIFNVSGNPLADRELPNFAAAPSRCSVCLDSTPLTNAALEKLGGLKASVSVSRTRIEQAAVDAMKNSSDRITDAKKAINAESTPPAPPRPLAELLPPQPDKLYEKLKRSPSVDETSPDRPVVGLDLSGSEVSDLDLAELRELASLRMLNLSNTKVTGAGLAYVSGLTSLENLDLDRTTVTPESLAHLKTLRKLERLKLPSLTASEKQLEPLGELTNLVDIDRPQGTPEEVWMTIVPRWEKLSVLSVGQNQFLDSVARMTSLKRVRVGEWISNAGLFCLKPLKELRRLELDSRHVSDPGMVNVNGLHELVELRIPHAPIGDAGMNQIKGAFKLSQLTIGNGYLLTDRAAADIRDLPSMAELTVRDPKFTDKGFEMLCELKDLEHLVLPGTVKLTDAIWNHAKKLEELRTLDVSGSRITGKGIDAISELTRLRTLNFANTQLGDEALTYLRRLPALLELNLTGSKVTDGAVKELQAARPTLKIVR